MQFTVVSYKVNHHFEGLWIAVDEYFVLFFLECMPPRKHRLQHTALNMAQRGLPDLEFFVATYV